jgi:hypothetical protein
MLRINDGVKTLQGLTVILGGGLTLSESSDGFPQIDVTPSAPGTTFESVLNILANTSPGGHRQLRLIDRTTATKYNWMIGTQSASDDVEITPSTTIGGTTFSTPIITFKRTGNVGIGTTLPNTRLQISATGIVLGLENTAGTSNNKKWDWDFGAGNSLNFRAVNDAYSSAGLYMNVERSGTTISSVSFPNGNIGIGTATPAAPTKLQVVGGNVRHEYSTGSAALGIFTSGAGIHLSENAYYDGTWKTIQTGKASRLQTDTGSGYALRLAVDNTSRAADAARSYTNVIQVDMVGNTEVLGTGSSAGKFKANRVVLPAGVDLWAT